ncbi:MAG: helix-turn-helix transcriptional regulator [Ktedonobacteraceae bacterium]|nr:helix-turn-helix transcriptional regulator [Ktedonobacteraceae bacterium]
MEAVSHHHHGIVIKEARQAARMTQEQLAELWPKADGGVGVSWHYVQDVEYGKRRIESRYTLRELAKLLSIPLWKFGLSEYDPFNPHTLLEYGTSLTEAAEQGSATDAEKEKSVEHSLAASQATAVDTREGVHDLDNQNEQSTHAQRTLLILPSSAVQPAKLEGAAIPDRATQFGITCSRIITLIHQWHGMALFCHDLQTRLDQEIKEFDMLKLQYSLEEHTLSRHDFLIMLATLPTALLASSRQAHKTLVLVEEFLPQCAASLTACWHLSRGSRLETIPSTLESFLPTLLSIITHVPTYREVVADLVAQSYALKTMLAWHLEGLSQAEAYCLQALKYSAIANNPNLQMRALSRLAVIAHYDSNFPLALTRSEAALAILQQTDQGQVFPMVKSVVYMPLAALQAYHRLKREAEQSLEYAQEAVAAQSSHEPLPLYVDWTKLGVTFWDGLTQYYLGQDNRKHAKQAWTVLKQFGQLEPSTTISERSRLECVNSRALAAVQLNEMEEAVACFEAAKQGARDLGSKQRSTEVGHVYSEMLKRWPSERRIVTLEPSSQR